MEMELLSSPIHRPLNSLLVAPPPPAVVHVLTTVFVPPLQTVHQAQCLANQVQLFYGTQRKETFQLVENFNHHPADFKHMLVIAELEQSGMGQAAPPGGP